MTQENTNGGRDGQESNRYLTFILDQEEYGVDILSIQELRGWEEPTPIPHMPAWIQGVINLRGMIVPIISMRERFNLASLAPSSVTVVIIVNVRHDNGERIMGLVVDGVSEVYTVDGELMQAPPNLGKNICIDFIKGLATIDDKMLILLNVDKLINEGIINAIVPEEGGAVGGDVPSISDDAVSVG